MKNITIFVSILFMLLLFAANNAFAQQKGCQLLTRAYPPNTKIENKKNVIIAGNETEDEYGNYVSVTTFQTIFEKNNFKECEILEVTFKAGFMDQKIAPTDEISIDFESISNKFLFDKENDRKLILQADESDVFSATLNQNARDKVKNKIKRENLTSDTDLNFANLKQLAEAKSVTIKLGKKVITLTSEQHQAIKDFYNEMNNPVVKDESKN
jgi:hypothetical protein